MGPYLDQCNLAKRVVWELEKEDLTAFICQIETMDARVWLPEVMAALKYEELTRVVVRLWAVTPRCYASI